ncbi:MAG TPA: DUF2282 domain-containing protein [Burkholderiales bacterium]|jgi:uncharacterized membrane protein|nr:DUF2282 domain-containing protein [Burkholderiales bacterium]
MRKSDVILATAVAGLLSATISLSSVAAEKPKPEKCYGISKAGQNDCQTANSACAGTSKADSQKDAWLYVPKGTCEKIVGGSLKAGKA